MWRRATVLARTQVRDELEPERFVAIGMSSQARSSSSCTASGERSCGSSARGGPPVGNAKPMNEDENPIEPSEESLTEIPEQDFSRAIRPNRYANLRGAFRHAVFVDREVWEHFGSEERIREALRLLVDIAKKRPA